MAETAGAWLGVRAETRASKVVAEEVAHENRHPDLVFEMDPECSAHCCLLSGLCCTVIPERYS